MRSLLGRVAERLRPACGWCGWILISWWACRISPSVHGHTRQNAQEWISGERNGDLRSSPCRPKAAQDSRWSGARAEVNAWLRPLGLDDQATWPTREESAFGDVAPTGQWGEEQAARPLGRAAPGSPARGRDGQITPVRLRHSPESRRGTASSSSASRRARAVTGPGPAAPVRRAGRRSRIPARGRTSGVASRRGRHERRIRLGDRA